MHHVILYEAAGAQATAATQLNAASGGKGWTCFGGPDLPVDLAARRRDRPARAAAVDRRVGAGPHDERAAAGTGVLLHEGREDRDAGALQPDRGVAARPFAAWLRVRPATTPLTKLETHLIAAPVELPCPTGVSGPQCSRTQAIQDEVDEVRRARRRSSRTALLRLCGKTLADYPNDVGAGTKITTSCDRAVRRGRRRSTASPDTCTSAGTTSRSSSTRARRRSRRCCTSRRGTSTGRTSTT